MSEGAVVDYLRPVNEDDRAMVVTVWQLVDGEYVCHCGAPAVLEVRTEPDTEPGVVCAEHGLEWIDLSTSLWRRNNSRGRS